MSSIYKNKTFLYDLDNNALYMGNYQPSRGLTAHARLANSFALDVPENGGPSLVGGYFNAEGRMMWNSGTIQGFRGGEAVGTMYSQFGVHPHQTNPKVYYGNRVPFNFRLD
eukprot:gene1132-1236_t